MSRAQRRVLSIAPWWRLAALLVAIGVIWCGLLPQLLRCAGVAGHVARMEERGINPAAMYYTELERLPVRPGWVERRIVLWP
jgi:hypothetical protein